MPTVSIIVPVYNSKEFLPECLSSILCQHYSDIEVLLIDDGSTDGSGQLCDNYSAEDKRIRAIHKKNGGVSSARNIGLEKATGEWVMFLDSDDLLTEDAIENLMRDVNDDIDMSYGGLRKFNEENCNIETVTSEEGVLTAEQCLDHAIRPSVSVGDWQRYIVNRVFRKSIIDSYKLRFREDIYYKEDGLFLISYIVRSKKNAICIPNIVYLYRQVPDSAMNGLEQSFNPKIFTLLDAHGAILQELKEIDAPQIKKRELRHLFRNRVWILGKMKKNGAVNFSNLKLLQSKLIQNGGFLPYLYYSLVDYCTLLKESFLRRIKSNISQDKA